MILYPVYLFLIWRNLVFTSQYLSISDVPYYSTSVSSVWNAFYGPNRWASVLPWLIYFTDLFTPLYVILTLYMFIFEYRDGEKTKFQWGVRLFFGLFIVIQLLKFIYIWISILFCPSVQMCRSYTSNISSSLYPNWTWIGMTIYQTLMLFITLAYFILIHSNIDLKKMIAETNSKIKKN